MERKDFQTIGDVLRQAVEESCLDTRLAEVRAAKLWPVVIGEPVARLTGTPVVKGGVMRVPVASASLRHDLSMHKSMLMRQINTLLKREVISDIRFVGDGTPR